MCRTIEMMLEIIADQRADQQRRWRMASQDRQQRFTPIAPRPEGLIPGGRASVQALSDHVVAIHQAE